MSDEVCVTTVGRGSTPGAASGSERPLDLPALVARVSDERSRARQVRRRSRHEMQVSRRLWRDFTGPVFALDPPGGSHLVLVVDDDEAIRSTFADILRIAGYEVLEAPDGAVAMQILTEFPVVAVVLDVQMPVLDGLSLLAQIDAPPPVVLATAHSYDDAVVRHRDKIFAYVQKPVPPSVLIAKVSEAVASARP